MIRVALGVVVLSVVVSLGCGATARPPASTPASEARLKDSVPERIAAQRAADRNVRGDEQEQRWGIEQAAERRRREDAAHAKARQDPQPPASGVDLRKDKQP